MEMLTQHKWQDIMQFYSIPKHLKLFDHIHFDQRLSSCI